MQNNWMKTNNTFLDDVATKYEQSARVSLETRALVVAEVNKALLSKFETLHDKNEYLVRLKF